MWNRTYKGFADLSPKANPVLSRMGLQLGSSWGCFVICLGHTIRGNCEAADVCLQVTDLGIDEAMGFVERSQGRVEVAEDSP